ncbi:MAG: SUMF1/EgtB/PvdO family nonheme iron enzyme [Deltaproteobacteria bacterium]|nr:SUMF1/EgtB/PvdO family nonheme iron enzyme [Deltaproteobacteria bacterium]
MASRWFDRALMGTGALAASVIALACALVACGSAAGGTRGDTSSAPAKERALGVTARGSLGASNVGGGGAEADRKARRGEIARERRGDGLRGRCPSAMAEIDGTFCIDRYEASLVDVLPNGEERPHSPFDGVGEATVRAVSAPHVFPQGYISAVEAQRACTASGKRLCRVAEWQKACRGPESKSWGYGVSREPGRCNDNGRNPVLSLYGRSRGNWTWRTMNQPELNQLERTLAKTGDHEGCTNGYGVYDMVGNLHEWVADPNGTFYGGYYQDVSSKGHGEGCGYLTTAHEARYHDYSTGFRCCADVAGASTRAR